LIPLVLTSASETPRMMTKGEFELKSEKLGLDEYFEVVVYIA
jgi:hypothetical protein